MAYLRSKQQRESFHFKLTYVLQIELLSQLRSFHKYNFLLNKAGSNRDQKLEKALRYFQDIRRPKSTYFPRSQNSFSNTIIQDKGECFFILSKLRSFRNAILTFFHLSGSVEEKYGDLNKRNYNLDHLARMNFRRSYRTGQLSTRHILGGL